MNEKQYLKISWHNTLRSDLNYHHTVQNFVKTVLIPSGYTFFTWNGRIYEYQNEKYIDTGLLEEDLGK